MNNYQIITCLMVSILVSCNSTSNAKAEDVSSTYYCIVKEGYQLQDNGTLEKLPDTSSVRGSRMNVDKLTGAISSYHSKSIKPSNPMYKNVNIINHVVDDASTKGQAFKSFSSYSWELKNGSKMGALTTIEIWSRIGLKDKNQKYLPATYSYSPSIAASVYSALCTDVKSDAIKMFKEVKEELN